MSSGQTEEFYIAKIDNPTSVDELKDIWRNSLTGPQDDMWEAFTNYASHWEIRNRKELIGYACANDEHGLLQFFVLPKWLQYDTEIFHQFITQEKFKKAMVGTNNPLCLSAALHFQKHVQVDTYLFTDYIKTEAREEDLPLRLANDKELERIVEYYHESMGGPKEWLTGYLRNLISKGELFLLENNSEIMGSCEVRKSEKDSGFANVGMTVNSAHRRKGLGTYLLGKAKDIAIEQGRKPICSCEKENIGSLKSIQKSGFRSIHQMLYMEF